MTKKPFLSSLAALCLLAVMAASASAGVDEAVQRIQKAYEGIHDMKGTFTQKTVIKALNKADSYGGEFFIKRPLRMKWAYKGKASQDLLISNDTVLIFKKGDNQAYRSRFSKETFGQSPVVLLTGMGNIREEFTVTGSDRSLALKPKKPMPGVVSITIHIADADAEFPIRSFTILDNRSNTIEIDLRDLKINTGIPDSLFDLHLPKGVTVLEQ